MPQQMRTGGGHGGGDDRENLRRWLGGEEADHEGMQTGGGHQQMPGVDIAVDPPGMTGGGAVGGGGQQPGITGGQSQPGLMGGPRGQLGGPTPNGDGGLGRPPSIGDITGGGFGDRGPTFTAGGGGPEMPTQGRPSWIDDFDTDAATQDGDTRGEIADGQGEQDPTRHIDEWDFQPPGGWDGEGVSPPPPTPPPSPPPGAPDFQGIADEVPGMEDAALAGDVQEGIQQWLDDPNPYMSDFAQAQREAMEGQLDQFTEEGTREMEEHMAQRGLIGSSVEADQMRELIGDRERMAAEQERELMDRLVGAEAEGRRGAIGAGMQFTDQEQQAALQDAQMQMDAALAGDSAAMDRVRHNLDVMRQQDAQQMDRAQLELQNEQIEQRAWEVMSQMEMQGQEIDFERARMMAEMEMRQQQMQRQQQRWEDEFDERMRQHDDMMDWRMAGLP